MEDSPCCYLTWERRLVARFPCNLAGFSACSTLALKDLEPPRRAPNLSPEPSPKEAVSVVDRANSRRPSPRSPSHSTLWCAIGYQASAERGWCVVKPGATSSVTSVGSHSRETLEKRCRLIGARQSCASAPDSACVSESRFRSAGPHVGNTVTDSARSVVEGVSGGVTLVGRAPPGRAGRHT